MPAPLKRKSYIAKIESDDEERTVTAVISTGAIDRDHEVLLPKGGSFEEFEKNPVVLWAHDHHETPVGKALWITRKGQKIIAKTQFAETDKGKEVFQLFKGGFLNAFSVGFMPIKGHSPTPDDIRKNPDLADAFWIYDKWNLLEYSPVPVPSNPEALATAVKSKAVELSDETIKELGIKVEAAEPEPEPEPTNTTVKVFKVECTTCKHLLKNDDGLEICKIEDCEWIQKEDTSDVTPPEVTPVEIEVEAVKEVTVTPAPVEDEVAEIKVEPIVNYTEITQEAIKRKKGIMY